MARMRRREDPVRADALPLGIRTKWGDCATFIKGELLAAKGQREAGLMQIDSALALLRDAHARRAWSWMAAEAIEECLAVDRIGQALALLTEAFENVERNDERYGEAELYRLKGELFRAQAKRSHPSTIGSGKGSRRAISKLPAASDPSSRPSRARLDLFSQCCVMYRAGCGDAFLPRHAGRRNVTRNGCVSPVCTVPLRAD